MSPTIHCPVWDNVLYFAIASDEPMTPEVVRAALADFGIDTGPSTRRVLAAVRLARAGGGGPPEGGRVPPPAAPEGDPGSPDLRSRVR